MTDALWTYAFVCLSAFAAGAVNSVAGGGTLLTFPALLAALVSVDEDKRAAWANATSTVALLPGSLAAAVGFRRELAESRRFVWRMLPPSVLGGLAGALLLEHYPQEFGPLVPWLILLAAVLFMLQAPLGRYLRRHQGDLHEPGAAADAGLIAFQFLVAVYGGYFGAGIGILMLTALGFMGVGDIHRMNGVKTLLAAVINGVAVAIFVAGGLVDWPFAGAMAAAAIVGGYAGARISRRLPAAYVRWIVVAIGFGLSAYYFAR
jgi:uncharacterized membrane protein YfcA